MRQQLGEHVVELDYYDLAAPPQVAHAIERPPEAVELQKPDHASLCTPAGPDARAGVATHAGAWSWEQATSVPERTARFATVLRVGETADEHIYYMNARGRVLTSHSATGQRTLSHYDAHGRRVGYRDEQGVTECVDYVDTTWPWVVGHATRYPSGGAPGFAEPEVVRYDWTPSGALTAISHVNTKQPEWQFAYDAPGRLQTRIRRSHLGDTREERFAYDLMGRLAGWVVVGPGDEHELKYDGAGFVAEHRRANPAPGEEPLTTQWLRDEAGRPVKRSGNHGSTASWTYSAAGRLLHQEVGLVESEPWTVEFDYDARGQLERWADNERVVELWYDDRGQVRQRRVTAHGDGAPPLWECLRHDALGELVEHVDPRGVRTTIVRDPLGRALRVAQSPASAATTPSLNPSSADWDLPCLPPTGGSAPPAPPVTLLEIAYDPGGRPSVVREPHTELHLRYDGFGALYAERRLGCTQSGRCDASHDQSVERRWAQRQTSDGLKRWSWTLRGPGPLADAYEESDIWELDPALVSATFDVIDVWGRPLQSHQLWFIDDPETGERAVLGWPGRTYTWHSSGSSVQVLDEEGHNAVQAWDSLGRPVLQHGPGNSRVRLEYEEYGRAVRVKVDAPTPSGVLQQIHRVRAGGLIREVWDGQGELRTRTFFDARGRPTLEWTAAGGLYLERGAFGRIERRWRLEAPLDASAGGTAAGHDWGGADISGTVGPTMLFDGVASQSGAELWDEWRYDDRGRRDGVIDAQGNLTAWSFDELSRVASVAHPGGEEELLQYAPGEPDLVAQQDRRGQWIALRYDAYGDPYGLDVQSDDGFGAPLQWRRYRDAAGVRKITESAAAAGQSGELRWLERWYDSRGLLVGETGSESVGPVGTERDALGRVVEVAAPGLKTRYQYDAGALRELHIERPGAPAELFARLHYNGGAALPAAVERASGLMEQRTFDEQLGLTALHVGAEGAPGVHTAQWTHDRYGRLRHVVRPAPSGGAAAAGVLAGLASVYAHDGYGRLRAENHDIPIELPPPPSLGPLGSGSGTDTEVFSSALSKWLDPATGSAPRQYDAVDNLLHLGAGEGAGLPVPLSPQIGVENRYDSFGGALQYDGAGNTTTLPQGAQIAYDALGRLQSWTSPDGQSWQLHYDPQHRLAAVQGPDGSELALTYLGPHLLSSTLLPADPDEDAEHRSYVLDPTGRALGLLDSAGGTYHLHLGRGGATECVTDLGGAVIERYRGTAHGRPRVFGANGDPQGAHSAIGHLRHQPSGIFLPELGASHHGARWLHPDLGRFLSPDPAGLLDGPNRYLYAGADPLHLHDPTGLARQSLGEDVALGARALATALSDTAEGALGLATAFADAMGDYGPAGPVVAGAQLGGALLQGGYDALVGATDFVRVWSQDDIHRAWAWWGAGKTADQVGAAVLKAAASAYGPARLGANAARGAAGRAGWGGASKGGFGRLTSTGPGQWRSSGGLIYGQGSAQGNRVKHVLAHTVPNPSKPLHSVFNVGRDKVLGLVDEAWAARGASLPGDPGAFVVPMGRAVGTAGETAVKVVVKPGTSEIITAFPVFP